MSVAAIGYVRMEATDTDAWMQFGTGVLGLMDAGREDAAGARFLRMDRHPFRFMLEPGGADRLLAAGLECRDEAGWCTLCDALAAAGHAPETGSPEEAARRCVSAFATVHDPSGNCVELALDRVKTAGLPLLATLGRHVNDNMCSFHVLAPGGIAVEYGYDGLLVDWDNYTPTVSIEGDLWGHEYHFPGVND